MELILYFEDDKSTENVDGSVAIPRKIHFITIACFGLAPNSAVHDEQLSTYTK